MEKKQYSGVVIGCNMGLEHIRSIHKNLLTKLYSICDTDPTRMENITKEFMPEKAAQANGEFAPSGTR